MTQRGSIAYYSAAVVCGSFFLAASYYGYFLWTGASSQQWGRDFLFIYVITIPLALLPQLLSAWLLRRVALLIAPRSLPVWLACGTIVWLAVLWSVGQLGSAVEPLRPASPWVNLKVAVMFLLVGPWFALQQPLWIPVPGAAATAWVLFLVHRAFEEQK